MKKNNSPPHLIKSKPNDAEDWEVLHNSLSDEEKQRSLNSTLQSSSKINKEDDNPGTSELNQSCARNKIENRSRSKTELTLSTSCCTGCKHAIEQLTETVNSQEKEITELKEKLHWMEKQKLCLSSAQESSDEERSEKRAVSDTYLYLLKVCELRLLENYEQSRRYRKKKRPGGRRALVPELYCLSEDEKKLDEIQQILSQQMFGDDVFKFFRYFHPNPEPHVSDFLYRCKTSYQQVNQAFAELRKLGSEKFNPATIHECLIKIRCRKYADLIKHILDEQAYNEHASSTASPQTKNNCQKQSFNGTDHPSSSKSSNRRSSSDT